jgi:hypothetical protein
VQNSESGIPHSVLSVSSCSSKFVCRVFSGCAFAPWRLCVKNEEIQREGVRTPKRKAAEKARRLLCKMLAAKERKEHIDKNLQCLFPL